MFDVMIGVCAAERRVSHSDPPAGEVRAGAGLGSSEFPSATAIDDPNVNAYTLVYPPASYNTVVATMGYALKF